MILDGETVRELVILEISRPAAVWTEFETLPDGTDREVSRHLVDALGNRLRILGHALISEPCAEIVESLPYRIVKPGHDKSRQETINEGERLEPR